MSVLIQGELEVDRIRGVLYFHNHLNGCTTLRICGLQKELEKFTSSVQIDITVAVKDLPKISGVRAVIITKSDMDDCKKKVK